MNQLYQGDNLQILRNMPDASVDLIATDPPFNTGKDWGAFSDKWEGGLKGYLKFMEPRLIECRRVLKDTGSLYLHCDPTASHYLKVMLDSMFGIGNFRNEIVWKRHIGQANDAKRKFPVSHDILLFYSKTDSYIFTPVFKPHSPEYIKDFYDKKDDNGRRYTETFGCGTKGRNKPNGERYPKKRTYLDELQGVLCGSIWVEKDLQLVSNAKERLGYPTQKPVALYERMIKASSNQGDTVLDPFAGSGTTLDAAQTLGRAWIGIDIGETAIETIQDRLRNRHGLEYARDYELNVNPNENA